MIAEKLRQYVLSHFPLAKQRSISDDDQLVETGIVDSLGVLDLVSFVETEFKIAVGDDELLPENFRSIKSLAQFVERKQNGA